MRQEEVWPRTIKRVFGHYVAVAIHAVTQHTERRVLDGLSSHFLQHRSVCGTSPEARKAPQRPANPLIRKPSALYTKSMGLWDRFWSKVAANDNGCWEWQAALDRDGYGRIGYGGRTFAAHRVSYRWWVGPIPYWLQVDHLCRNHACVNPDHLEAVTCKTNIRRGNTGRWRRADDCTAGHPLSGDNLIIRWDNSGRRCRTCQLARVRDWRQRQRLAATCAQLSA